MSSVIASQTIGASNLHVQLRAAAPRSLSWLFEAAPLNLNSDSLLVFSGQSQAPAAWNFPPGAFAVPMP